MLRILRYFSWALLTVLSFAVAGAFLHKQGDNKSTPSPDSQTTIGSSFQLIDHNGLPITERVLSEGPSAIFFGFTHCPEICPTTLQNLSVWSKQIEDGQDSTLKILFFTIDPIRDTPSVLKTFVSQFSNNITAITGKPQQIEQLIKSWHVYAKRIPLDDGDYTMDHTAAVFLIRRDGTLQGTISHQDNRHTAIEKLRLLISS